MEQPESSPFLEAERKSTDESLVAERDKTNQSIDSSRSRSEHRTNKNVQAERKKADDITSTVRDNADLARDIQREASGIELNEEQKNGDSRLAIERSRADTATEDSRKQVDAAFDRERNMKNALLSKLLDQERFQTDHNLEVERDRTDLEVQSAANLLSKEVADHLKTKVTLTTRDEFLAIVSHDLKNPIGAVSSCAEMLLDDATYKSIEPEIRTWIEFMKRNADRSLRLISDLLDMERIAEGKLYLKPTQVSVSQIARESIESFAQIALAKNIVLRSMPSDISGVVVCDRDRIMQVLSNLLANALKFTSEGGSVTVKTNLTEKEAQFSVRDSGVGIPVEKRDHIFDRFTQLGANDRRGLGLGLYISKMLIEAHTGRLWVQSEMGVGSTFYFAIPRRLDGTRHDSRRGRRGKLL